MGIEQEFQFGANCARCFDFLKAPQVMRMSVQGIEKGDDWMPFDPDPPNGTFELQNQGRCDWAIFGADFGASCTFTGAGTQMAVFVIPVGGAFFFQTANQCWQSGAKQID